MRVLLSISLLLCSGVTAVGSSTILIPFDSQIDIGLGPAIGPTDPSVTGLDRITFENDGGVGFTRMHLLQDNGAQSYFWGPYIDLVAAGIGPLNLSAPGSTISFDARYFQDPANYPPGTPWTRQDAPIGMAIWDLSGAQRGFWYPYRSQAGDPPYPTWTHIVVDLANAVPPKIDILGDPLADMTQVYAIEFFGTDWSGSGNDFVDIKSLEIDVTPEPAPAITVLLGLGGLAIVRRRRHGVATGRILRFGNQGR